MNNPFLSTKKTLLGAAAVLLFLILLSAGCTVNPNMTVTFYTDETIYSQLQIDGQSRITLPVNPVKEGYTFKGWYFDKGVWAEPFTGNSLGDIPLVNTVSLYAYFVKNSEIDHVGNIIEYLVRFDTNNKSWIPPQSVRGGSTVSIPTPNPEADGYTFAGWYTTSACKDSEEWDFHNDVVQHDLTLYAKWIAQKQAAYYLDGYQITPLHEISGVCFSDSKVYVRYNIAKVTETTLSVLSSTVQNTGGQSLTIGSRHAISEATMQSLETTISNSVGGSNTTSTEMSHGGNVQLTLLPWIQLDVHGDFTSSDTYEDTWEQTTSTTESHAYTVEYATENSEEHTLDLSGYPTGEWYRYVVRGDCIITQTFEYDIATKKYSTYFDSRVIKDSCHMVVEYCHPNENFVIPVSSVANTQMSTVDLSTLLSGEGTEQNPYLISCPEEFLLVSLDLSAHYKLADNIDLTGYPLPVTNEFSGYFDGGGHTITGSKTGNTILTVDTSKFSSEQYYGLFAKNSGTIKDLTLSHFNLLGEEAQHNGAWVFMGCVAGENSGTISQVHLNDCEVTCHRAASSIGLVTGVNKGRIENCEVTRGCVFGNGDGGGITGTNHGIIQSCSVTGNGINSNEDYFLYFWRVHKESGDNGGHGRSWGGIAGYATANSKISDISVSSVFIRCHLDPGYGCNVGYLVGNNEGTISGSGTVNSVRDSLNLHANYKPEDAKKNYLTSNGGNGYVGLNAGSSPW